MGAGRSLWRGLLGVAVGLAGGRTALAAEAGEATDQGGPEAVQPRETGSIRDIVVFGRRDDGTLEGVAADDELGEADIAGYGQGSIGELLEAIGRVLDSGEDGPLVLIDGKPSNGISDISDLPTEAVRRIQLLPRAVAVQQGLRPDRRVVNVVLKRDFRQVTTKGEAGFATVGAGLSGAAEAGFTRFANGNRTNLTLRAEGAARLLESDRGIDTAADAGVPYALGGNIVASALSGPIDPAFSAYAGRPVAVIGLPGTGGTQTFATLLPGADRPNLTDTGTYRTLLPETRTYSANLSLARKLGQSTSLLINLRGDLREADGLVGAPEVLLNVPATTPFTPFSQPVRLAYLVDRKLAQARDSRSLTASATLNGMLGAVRYSVQGQYILRRSETLTDRQYDAAALQAAITAGLVNPFTPTVLSGLGELRRDQSNNRSDRASLSLLLAGKPFTLPAGPAELTLRLGGVLDRASSDSTLLGVPRATRYRRDEFNAQLGLVAPIIKAGQAGAGDLSLNLSGSLRDAVLVGTMTNYAGGLTWRPLPRTTLSAMLAHEETPPSIGYLADPLIATSGVRVFDYLRNQTVGVTMLTGGNPALPVESRRVLRLGAIIQPVARRGLTLDVEYLNSRGRNALAALPPVSAAVQAAFPDRYQRDASGLLVLVDARAVSFARESSEQLRWGITLRELLGRGSGRPLTGDPGDDGDGGGELRAAKGLWRFTGSIQHTWALANRRLARVGLAEIDMLDGGAAGYGPGIPRHQVTFDWGLSGRGLGLRLSGNWRSGSTIRGSATAGPADLHFARYSQLDLRAFADLEQLLPDSAWAKRTRVALDVKNLTNSQQSVRDGAGGVPLRYQRYLLDPLGRTITLSLRKAF